VLQVEAAQSRVAAAEAAAADAMAGAIADAGDGGGDGGAAAAAAAALAAVAADLGLPPGAGGMDVQLALTEKLAEVILCTHAYNLV
jgi:hypothetical protein